MLGNVSDEALGDAMLEVAESTRYMGTGGLYLVDRHRTSPTTDQRRRAAVDPLVISLLRVDIPVRSGYPAISQVLHARAPCADHLASIHR
ncbi:hypothetical protein NLM24_04795 [Nocardia zapadnayensis]|nr:hypothetical protein [Nocardia zapadnayensis]MCX0270037.1 hypothetical protein [Nocardia zapadnayensis]